MINKIKYGSLWKLNMYVHGAASGVASASSGAVRQLKVTCIYIHMMGRLAN